MIFKTKNPNLRRMTGEAETYVANVDGSSKPSYGTAAAISVPLVEDKLGLRISGGTDYRAGYADVYSGAPVGKPRIADANKVDKSDVRVVLYWTPSDAFTARFQYLHFGGKQGFSQQMNSLKPSYFENWGNVDGYEKSKNDLYGLTLTYDFGFATLTSATGGLHYNTSYLSGLKYPGLGMGNLFNGYDGKSFTEELRLVSNSPGPMHWIGGLYYNNASNAFEQTIDFEVPVLNGTAVTTTKTKNQSVFGEVSYDLFGGKLVPLIGLRHYKDNRSYLVEPISPAGPTQTGNASPSVNTWRANLSYHPDADMTVYANAGTGFRSGIVQSQLQVAALKIDGITEGNALKPDRVKNFELGVKGTLRPQHLTYEFNIYQMKYLGLQTGLYTTSAIAAFASLGDTQIRGLDLAVQWSPIRGLNVGVSGDVNDSKYAGINPLVARGISAGVREGEQLVNTPNFTARFDIGYTRSLNETWTMYSNGSVSRSGARSNQYGDKTAIFNLIDANFGVRSKTYDLELYGQNLSDERGPWFIRQAGFVGGPVPRTIGIRGRYRY